MDSVTANTGMKLQMKPSSYGKFALTVALSLLLIFGSSVPGFCESTTDFKDLPVKGMVTMIDLGAKKCIPCKMMAPILEKMEKKYRGRAAIVFIDVWENRDQAGRFGVSAIPTQVFYDAAGKEISRHTGFMSEKEIESMLTRLGVQP